VLEGPKDEESLWFPGGGKKTERRWSAGNNYSVTRCKAGWEWARRGSNKMWSGPAEDHKTQKRGGNMPPSAQHGGKSPRRKGGGPKCK